MGNSYKHPNGHLSGRKCPHCEDIVRSIALKKKSEERIIQASLEFTTKSNLIHKNKYDYSLVEYQMSNNKVKIICKQHGSFQQTPSNHLQGNGCPVCALSEKGWTRTKFADKCEKNNNGLGILYILGCWDASKTEVFVKIGITSTSVKKRYGSKTSMPYNFKVLHEIVGSPEYIYNLETLLHKKSKNYKYIPITSFAGSSTECFKADKDYLQKLNSYMKELVPF